MCFQDMILNLQQFWGKQGCVILQPYDMEMGAEHFTGQPSCVIGIGTKPWECAYAQPCRRPTDGRYGENPNRLGHYYQFLLLMKPSPDNIQDLYIESKALGVDLTKHDLSCRRQLGVTHIRRLGSRMGSLARWHGSHSVHLFSAMRGD